MAYRRICPKDLSSKEMFFTNRHNSWFISFSFSFSLWKFTLGSLESSTGTVLDKCKGKSWRNRKQSLYLWVVRNGHILDDPRDSFQRFTVAAWGYPWIIILFPQWMVHGRLNASWKISSLAVRILTCNGELMVWK